MHELSITQNIVEIIVEKTLKEGFNKVNSVSLEIGKISGVVPDAVEFCYDVVTKGTIAEGSKLVIDVKEAVILCGDCKKNFEIEDIFCICPECSGINVQYISGKELKIKDMEVE